MAPGMGDCDRMELMQTTWPCCSSSMRGRKALVVWGVTREQEAKIREGETDSGSAAIRTIVAFSIYAQTFDLKLTSYEKKELTLIFEIAFLV